MKTGNYFRVIPRDFFNEAKLLKCLGQLALKVLDHKCLDGLEILFDDERGDPFCIVQDDSDGSIYVANYPITINGFQVWFKTTLNSKEAYPLFAEWEYESYTVFNADGEFTDDFKKLADIII